MKVSILMSVYNGEKTIERAIESVKNQSYKNFECIIINDGSTDNSISIIRSLIKNDERFFFFEQKNQGLTKSLNLAFNKSTGELICRLDADDQFDPMKLERQVLYLKNNPDVSLVGSNAKLESNGDIYANTKLNFKSNNDILETLKQRKAFFCHSSWCLRRELFELNNGYNNFYKKAQDYDFILRALNKSKIRIIKDPLTTLHISSNTISHDSQNTQFIYATTAFFDFYNNEIPLEIKYEIINQKLNSYNFNYHYSYFLLALKIKRKLLSKEIRWLLDQHLTEIFKAMFGYLRIKGIISNINKCAEHSKYNKNAIYKL